MTEYTPEELAESASINTAIDAITDAVIVAGLSIASSQERDGPMNGLLIAEGVLGRIIASFAKVYGGGGQEGLDELMELSASHIRTLAQYNWDRLPCQAEFDEVDDDAAPDA